MSDIGPFKTTDCFEIAYNKPNGPPIEIEVEVSGILFCDSDEWGVEARDVTARFIERELSDEEIEALDLESTLTEAFLEGEPCVPRPGEHYKDLEDHVWKVVDTCLTWKTETRERYVLIERPNFTTMRGPRVMRRLVPLVEFTYGVDECNEEHKPLFRFTLNRKIKPGELHPPGDAK